MLHTKHFTLLTGGRLLTVIASVLTLGTLTLVALTLWPQGCCKVGKSKRPSGRCRRARRPPAGVRETLPGEAG